MGVQPAGQDILPGGVDGAFGAPARQIVPYLQDFAAPDEDIRTSDPLPGDKETSLDEDIGIGSNHLALFVLGAVQFVLVQCTPRGRRAPRSRGKSCMGGRGVQAMCSALAGLITVIFFISPPVTPRPLSLGKKSSKMRQ